MSDLIVLLVVILINQMSYNKDKIFPVLHLSQTGFPNFLHDFRAPKC